MPDMRLVIATLMGLVVVGMVLCVPYRAIDTLFTLVWVGMYLVLTMVVYCVWCANGVVRTRTHGTPLPKGRSHLRLVTPDYSIAVYGAIKGDAYIDYDPQLEYDLDHEEDQ